MKLVVGLGNPGRAYEQTRHNVGFWVLDAFALQHQISFSKKKGEAQTGRGVWPGTEEAIDFLLAKPQTFMNRSGHSVQALLSYYKIPLSELILVYDDLDLDIGRIRLKKMGRAGGHRGVASVIQALGSDQFVRIKIGIGRDPRIDATNYVLSPFSSDEKKKVLEAVDKGSTLLPLLLEGAISKAMNLYNAP
ncbi:MAG: aminoacyl-tRNA hydrolase [Nitrospiria bacterium]